MYVCGYIFLYVYMYVVVNFISIYIHTFVEHSLMKESGMLALGALASGCLQEMSGAYVLQYRVYHTYIHVTIGFSVGHLSALFPFLISTMQVLPYIHYTYIHISKYQYIHTYKHVGPSS